MELFSPLSFSSANHVRIPAQACFYKRHSSLQQIMINIINARILSWTYVPANDPFYHTSTQNMPLHAPLYIPMK